MTLWCDDVNDPVMWRRIVNLSPSIPLSRQVGEMDGHRAPVPGVSTMRSIDTQTPRDNQEDSSNSDGGNESTSRSHSVSPSSPPLDGGSRPSSRSSSAGNGDNKDIKGNKNRYYGTYIMEENLGGCTVNYLNGMWCFSKLDRRSICGEQAPLEHPFNVVVVLFFGGVFCLLLLAVIFSVMYRTEAVCLWVLCRYYIVILTLSSHMIINLYPFFLFGDASDLKGSPKKL